MDKESLTFKGKPTLMFGGVGLKMVSLHTAYNWHGNIVAVFILLHMSANKLLDII